MVSSSRGRGYPDKEFTGYRGAYGGGPPCANLVHSYRVTNDRSHNLSALAMPHCGGRLTALRVAADCAIVTGSR